MATQSTLVGNEALEQTLRELHGDHYTKQEVDAKVAETAGELLTYDAGTRSVSGLPFAAQIAHIITN